MSGITDKGVQNAACAAGGAEFSGFCSKERKDNGKFYPGIPGVC